MKRLGEALLWKGYSFCERQVCADFIRGAKGGRRGCICHCGQILILPVFKLKIDARIRSFTSCTVFLWSRKLLDVGVSGVVVSMLISGGSGGRLSLRLLPLDSRFSATILVISCLWTCWCRF